MAPAPDNQTNILFIDYTSGFNEHTMQFRFAPTVLAAAAWTAAFPFLEALEPGLNNNWGIVGARWKAAASEFTVPVGIPGILTPSGGVLDPIDAPRFVAYQGRGITDGRRWTLKVFGFVFASEPDYRLEINDNLNLVNGRSALLDMAANDGLRTIANSEVDLYPYNNWGYNAYWQRRSRE